MSIRIADRQDAPQLRALVIGLAAFYLPEPDFTPPKWFSVNLELAQFEARLVSDEFTNIVYELEGNLVGYLAMKGNSHLYHLFVAEEYQGKGIARQLWQQAIDRCPAPKYMVRSSIYAIPVYQKFGFINVGNIEEKDRMQYQMMELNKESVSTK
jgi:GNAT superfamily N-acetyltransferase